MMHHQQLGMVRIQAWAMLGRVILNATKAARGAGLGERIRTNPQGEIRAKSKLKAKATCHLKINQTRKRLAGGGGMFKGKASSLKPTASPFLRAMQIDSWLKNKLKKSLTRCLRGNDKIVGVVIMTVVLLLQGLVQSHQIKHRLVAFGKDDAEVRCRNATDLLPIMQVEHLTSLDETFMDAMISPHQTVCRVNTHLFPTRHVWWKLTLWSVAEALYALKFN